MKPVFRIIIIFLLILIISRDTYVKAQTNENGQDSSASQIEEIDNDFDFGSADFVDVPSHRISSPDKKGFPLSIVFTVLLWVVFFYLILPKGKVQLGEIIERDLQN